MNATTYISTNQPVISHVLNSHFSTKIESYKFLYRFDCFVKFCLLQKKILQPIDKVHCFYSLHSLLLLFRRHCCSSLSHNFFYFYFLINAPNRTSTCDLTHHPTWKCHQAQRPLADMNFSSIHIFLFPLSYSLASSFWLCLLY